MLFLTLIHYSQLFSLKVFFFTENELYSTFFSILVDKTRKYFWPSLGKKIHLEVMPKGFSESPSYFSQILKAALDDIKFPRVSIFL